jgi:uncharacterized protein YbgA (DUF1722 family)
MIYISALQEIVHCVLKNCGILSIKMARGYFQCAKTSRSKRSMTKPVVAFKMGKASIHLEKKSVTTWTKRFPLG